MNEADHFLAEIQAKPDDLSLRLVYADWLEERGDMGGAYLRADVELQNLLRSSSRSDADTERTVRQLRTRLTKLGKTLDATWVAIFDNLRPKFFRCRVCKQVISDDEAIDTSPRNSRKLKATRYCALCYEDAVRSQARQGFDIPSSRDSSEHIYHGYRGDDE